MPIKRYNGSSWDVVAGAGVVGAPGTNGTNGTNGIDASPYAAGKNKIINGDFGIWQRGTSGFSTGGAYNADRFAFYADGSGATKAITQQTFTSGTAPVAGYESQYYWRYNQTVAGTGGTENSFYQPIEDVRTFAGQTMTFSFWAKADTSRTVTVFPIQRFGSGGSSQVIVTSQTATLTTSWTRYSFTFTVPSISGKTIGTSSALFFYIQFPVNTTQTIDLWGIQAEAGSVATAFQTATGTIQGELAACQRYYWRSGGDNAYQFFAMGTAATTTLAKIAFNSPVPMRIAPTSLDYSTLYLYDGINATSTITSMVANYASKLTVLLEATVASGLTVNRPYLVGANNSLSAYIGLSAEL